MLREVALLLMAAALCSRPARAEVLTIEVRHQFHSSPLGLDALRFTTSSGETISVARLSYLLSGFALERENGGWEELPSQYAWLDAGARRTAFQLEAPSGKFRGIRFFVGPEPEANAAAADQFPANHPLNPNFNGLHWSWQGGYIFLALEGTFRVGNGPVRGYALHLARDQNRTAVTLPATLDLTHRSAALLEFDLGDLLDPRAENAAVGETASHRALSLKRDGDTTHSRPGDAVSATLIANLPGAFRMLGIAAAPSVNVRPEAVRPLWMPAVFTPYRFTFDRSFPLPDLPRDNPLITERVALGEALFYEKALSRDGAVACASCHDPAQSFSDARRFSLGVRGQAGARHAMPLVNLAWKTSFFWDGRAPSLRAQVLHPIQDPKEMDEILDRVAAKLSARPEYATRFAAAFDSAAVTPERLSLALEQYLLTLTCCDSDFDRARRGQGQLSPEARRGFELFMTERDPRTGQFGADCFHCHGGALFTDHQFHNNGLAPDPADEGRFRVTGNPADRGKFATPTLRNVARRGPYMHDGRFATLEEVVAHYSSGVHRTATLDPNLAKHPDEGLQLSALDQQALVAFLRTLSAPEPGLPK